jgi:osmotically-inducible protein OsmY
MMKQHPGIESRARGWLVAALCAAAAPALVSCAAPLLVGGAAAAGGGTNLALDRRSVGMQIEDTEIEHRVDSAVYDRFKIEPINMYVTSYNRKVLLTGQAPDDQTKQAVADIASRVENTGQIVNEMQIAPVSGHGPRADDTYIDSKVHVALLNASSPPFGVVKVKVTAGVVFLMGRVTEREGDDCAKNVSQVEGVKGVVKVFDYVNEAAIEKAPTTVPVVDTSSKTK